MTWLLIVLFAVLWIGIVSLAKFMLARARPAGIAAAPAEIILPDAEAGVDVFIPDVINDNDGQPVDTRDKYVGVVKGSTFSEEGLQDGTVFIGDFVSPEVVLVRGDYVIRKTVDGVHHIKRVTDIEEASLVLSDHAKVDKSDIVAKVTHALKAA